MGGRLEVPAALLTSASKPPESDTDSPFLVLRNPCHYLVGWANRGQMAGTEAQTLKSTWGQDVPRLHTEKPPTGQDLVMASGVDVDGQAPDMLQWGQWLSAFLLRGADCGSGQGCPQECTADGPRAHTFLLGMRAG